MSPPPLASVGDFVDEIRGRVRGLNAAASSQGRSVLAPLLVLGISERVGSNWLSDSLRTRLPQHNEPFRQQIAAGHPLSPLNPNLSTGPVHADLLGRLGTHWLATFVTSKYGTPRQMIKETNLFFATPVFLRLFPDSPVAVLTRSPVGIVSSFRRRALFQRWNYPGRYAQMVTMTRRKGQRRWAALVPDDAPDEIVALVRLIVLNTLLLAEAVTGRNLARVCYETAVHDPHAGLAALRGLLPDMTPTATQPQPVPADMDAALVDGTFATNRGQHSLLAVLRPAEADTVRAETTHRLAVAADQTTPLALRRARTWLTGDDRYDFTAPPGISTTASRRPRAGPPHTARYVNGDGLQWRTTLVTNAEFCAFLNALRRAGLTNTIQGTHLLLTEMPHARGGRIHYDPQADRHRVSAGYHDHPVYWVTWIGAAAYARHHAARLPTRRQAHRLTAGDTPNTTNTDYRVGDVSSVYEPDRGPNHIHHRLGNLQIWCADGPCNQPPPAGLTRYLHGAAWNTPATPDEIDRPRSRHLLGSSRGVGIRLLRYLTGVDDEITVEELAGRLATWIDALADHTAAADLDGILVAALTGSQADVGLGSHVATGPGKALPGQLPEPLPEAHAR